MRIRRFAGACAIPRTQIAPTSKTCLLRVQVPGHGLLGLLEFVCAAAAALLLAQADVVLEHRTSIGEHHLHLAGRTSLDPRRRDALGHSVTASFFSTLGGRTGGEHALPIMQIAVHRQRNDPGVGGGVLNRRPGGALERGGLGAL